MNVGVWDALGFGGFEESVEVVDVRVYAAVGDLRPSSVVGAWCTGGCNGRLGGVFGERDVCRPCGLESYAEDRATDQHGQRATRARCGGCVALPIVDNEVKWPK